MTRKPGPVLTIGSNRPSYHSAALRIENYLASLVEAKKIEPFPPISVPWLGILVIMQIDP
jgi:hypothetical protein